MSILCPSGRCARYAEAANLLDAYAIDISCRLFSLYTYVDVA